MPAPDIVQQLGCYEPGERIPPTPRQARLAKRHGIEYDPQTVSFDELAKLIMDHLVATYGVVPSARFRLAKHGDVTIVRVGPTGVVTILVESTGAKIGLKLALIVKGKKL